MDVDDGIVMSRMKQDQPEAGEAEALSDKSCCVRTWVRSVCKSKRNRSTTQEAQSRNWQSKNRMDPESTQTSSTFRMEELLLRCLR